jgi:hypothetical protein
MTAPTDAPRAPETVTLTITKADAETMLDLVDEGRAQVVKWLTHSHWTPAETARIVKDADDALRVYRIVEAALAAPAARAADAGTYIGRDALGNQVVVASNMHFSPSKIERAAMSRADRSQGAGEGS